MEVNKYVSLDYKEGKVVVAIDVAPTVNAFLDDTKAKVESGEIDLIKGTDIDKMVMLQAIELLKSYANPVVA